MLYVFSGEQASGAEIVIESLIFKNLDMVTPHLFISPGRFSEKLIASQKPYCITVLPQLRKLNRSKGSALTFYFRALENYFTISVKTLKYIRRHNIQIVHANTIVPASYLLPAITYTRIFRPATLWLWSDHDLVYFKKIDHFFSGVCRRLYNKTLVVSNAVKAKYGLLPKVEVLYNGLDTEVYKSDPVKRHAFRRQWGIADDVIVFAIAGIISPRKRQYELIEAFINAADGSSRLLLAGEFGPDDAAYNEKVQRLLEDNSNSVNYIGHVDDMVAFYNGCDVIVNNSSAKGSEPFGATIYEAMSCEKVVMAANTGGLPEIVDDSINGFLFEPDNRTSLELTIKKLNENYYSLDKIKKAARKKIIEKFDYLLIRSGYNEMLEPIS